jgi:transcriptional regulator with XRE-family HTH domain
MNEQAIGANIRNIRKQAGQTLTALAQQAQMTKSTLSKIETGQISPPISTLMRIAEALDVALAIFFQETDTPPKYALTRKDQGQVITRDGSKFGYSYEGLALELPGKYGEPFLLTIRPGDPIGQFQHGGQEFIYMLSGRMEFTIGEEVLRLGPGDSLYCDPTAPHNTKVLGKTPARFICVFLQNQSGKFKAHKQTKRS